MNASHLISCLFINLILVVISAAPLLAQDECTDLAGLKLDNANYQPGKQTW